MFLCCIACLISFYYPESLNLINKIPLIKKKISSKWQKKGGGKSCIEGKREKKHFQIVLSGWRLYGVDKRFFFF